ncbi:MAG: hypothetical protein H6660_04050 [Ardenticatenaceae bacterium]|nr:hypothetical protein [Ardenticatenaceae bacterium]
MTQSIWDKRASALEQILSFIQQQYAAAPDPVVNTTVKSIVAALNVFGQSQVQFFRDGINQGKLQPSSYFPWDYVWQTTLTQIANDTAVYQQTAAQRLSGSPEMQATLTKADQLAQDALNLAVDAKLLPVSCVLTYFNKTADIHVIPYAPVAVVGISFTATNAPRDYLAIAHEVGHHVFRHTPGLAKKLYRALPMDPLWREPWLEEMFADAFGCLVAGPVLGLDFQDLMLDDSLEDFIGDDGEHPVEMARPYFYNKMLQELGFTEAANALAERWEAALLTRNDPQYFVAAGSDELVSRAEAKEALETAVPILLDALKDVLALRQQTPAAYWSQDLAPGESPELLYDRFDQWVQQNPQVTVAQLEEFGDDIGVVIGASQPQNIRRKGTVQTWIDGLKSLTASYQLPPTAWTEILSAGNWNVKGPDGDNGTKG